MNLEHLHVTIEEVLETLPHKFRSGKNVKIILDAYLKQYNKMLETYSDSVVLYNIDKATGDQLDRIGSNFLVRRDNANDDDYREKIKFAFIVYKTSGNIYNFSKIFKEYLGIDATILHIYESGNANVILELNRENSLGTNIIQIINDIIQFGKPVGVGFSIEPYSSTILLDKYTQMQIESEMDKFNKRYMLSDKIMDNAYHMYSTYYMNIAVDRYLPSTLEVI
ncbi:MAG: hypothetical protein ACRC7S_19650 [Cetobacterium sp.]